MSASRRIRPIALLTALGLIKIARSNSSSRPTNPVTDPGPLYPDFKYRKQNRVTAPQSESWQQDSSSLVRRTRDQDTRSRPAAWSRMAHGSSHGAIPAPQNFLPRLAAFRFRASCAPITVPMSGSPLNSSLIMRVPSGLATNRAQGPQILPHYFRKTTQRYLTTSTQRPAHGAFGFHALSGFKMM